MFYATLFGYDVQEQKSYLIWLPFETIEKAQDKVIEIGRTEKYDGKIVESLGILANDGEVLYSYRNREFIEGLVRDEE